MSFSAGLPDAASPSSSSDLEAARWIGEYAPNDYLFASPRTTLLGRGVALNLAHETATPLTARVAALFDEAARRGMAQPVLIGAVPFDAAQPARLVIPAHWRRGGALVRENAPLRAGPCLGDVERLSPVPAEQVYCRAVDAALQRFRPDGLSKVVLARTLEITLPRPPARTQLMHNLLLGNPHGYTFAIPVADVPATSAGELPAFVGASPELLVRREGHRVIANPLAGSTARRADPEEDRRAAQALLASAKDLHEHAIVVRAVADALQPLCRTLAVPAEPVLTATDALWHLSTTVVGELADEATTSLALALALHPTPAVCGHPTAEAFAAIAELEPFARGFFAGMVGWCDASGDGEWAVALRCADCDGTRLRLYAGAGIVPGSEPVRELAETATKFRTMLRGMGLDAEPPAAG